MAAAYLISTQCWDRTPNQQIDIPDFEKKHIYVNRLNFIFIKRVVDHT